jgi:hypothetical protein
MPTTRSNTCVDKPTVKGTKKSDAADNATLAKCHTTPPAQTNPGGMYQCFECHGIHWSPLHEFNICDQCRILKIEKRIKYMG